MVLPDFIPPVIAHRGASAYAPENTLVSFTKAAQMGSRWIEFDVMLSADREVIVFHDETLARTTNGEGRVGDYPYSYLRTLDAGSWFAPEFSGERIPTLDLVAQFLIQTKMSANVEIKPLPGQDRETARRALEEIAKFFPHQDSTILFSSFSVEALQQLREISSDCLLGLLMHEWRDDWQSICDSLGCVSVHVGQKIMTMKMAETIKSTGRKLLCYTVNDPVRAKELFSWGVDAIFSDVPNMDL